MSATVTIECPPRRVRCPVPGGSIFVHMHPSGTPSSIEWMCPVCDDPHTRAATAAMAVACQVAGARIVSPGALVGATESWIARQTSLVIEEAEEACRSSAKVVRRRWWLRAAIAAFYAVLAVLFVAAWLR